MYKFRRKKYIIDSIQKMTEGANFNIKVFFSCERYVPTVSTTNKNCKALW